jgi:hypothetical protein
MQLPKDQSVDVGLLSAVFNNTTATYKFYWFLAILEAVEEGKSEIEKHELFARMITNAWYTVNYFHLSFGVHDKIQAAVETIKRLESFNIDEKKKDLFTKILHSKSKEVAKNLTHFNANVPFKFLSPWLGSHSEKDMYRMSQENVNFPLYALYPDRILLQPAWFEYVQKNSGFLKDFCFWNLTLFLQVRNPNVPNIPNKLKQPEKRGGLSSHKRNFWDLVLAEIGAECIYTSKKLEIGGYDVEHFIPFQFLSHDQMWNLIPADPSFNSKKGDKLPDLDTYFNGFYEVQENAVNYIKKVKPNNPYLEDYLYFFNDLKLSKEKYRDQLQPLISIAHNNGFEFMRS